jgi:predicted metal-binding protein DUF2103
LPSFCNLQSPIPPVFPDTLTPHPLQAIMKFGRIKRQHGRVGGLDKILDRIVRDCPYVSRIVPGRIKVRRGKSPASFKVQYPTGAGLKCIFTGTGTAQEVFLICSDTAAAHQWLLSENIATRGESDA